MKVYPSVFIEREKNKFTAKVLIGLGGKEGQESRAKDELKNNAHEVVLMYLSYLGVFCN